MEEEGGSLWLVYTYRKGAPLLPLSAFSITSLFSSHYQRSIIIMRNSWVEGRGGATTTLNFTSKLNPAGEVKWRHASFVRALVLSRRGGKRSNNIISITDFHAGLIIEPSSVSTRDLGGGKRLAWNHLIRVLIDDTLI